MGEGTTTRCNELKLMLNLATPSAVVNALRMAQALVDQAVVGHLTWQGRPTPIYLDAVALALLWMLLTLSAVQRGISGTVNALASQAVGAGNKRLADTWLMMGLMVSVPAAMMLSGLWLCTSPIVNIFAHNQSIGHGVDGPDAAGNSSMLLAPVYGNDDALLAGAGAEEDPVALAGLYARLSLGMILPTLWMEALNNWLIAQRVIRPQLLVYFLCFFLNLGLNLLLVHGIGGVGGYGFEGSPLATTATRVVQLLALVLVLPCAGVALPRFAFADAFRRARLRVFGAQLMPRTISSSLEEIALQAVGALAGRLDAIENATHNAMLMTFFWFTAPIYVRRRPRRRRPARTRRTTHGFTTPTDSRAAAFVGVPCMRDLSSSSRQGVGTATQQRMGYHLGAGKPAAAKTVGCICLVVQESIGLAVAGAMVALRFELGKVFSNDARVCASPPAEARSVGTRGLPRPAATLTSAPAPRAHGVSARALCSHGVCARALCS